MVTRDNTHTHTRTHIPDASLKLQTNRKWAEKEKTEKEERRTGERVQVVSLYSLLPTITGTYIRCLSVCSSCVTIPRIVFGSDSFLVLRDIRLAVAAGT